ncbi:MAG: Tetratricopeptide repeat protein [Candidatus Angelobacter sp.]|nr:Tetratricopeptide repeat protein [Candidatus Angelobacter sp.]
MKLPISVLVAFVLSSPINAQQHPTHSQPAAKKATLMAGLGDLHHPVSTSNPEAQKFFDQGMRLIFAFNHEEAAGSFERAAELDPKLAMAYWGLAEAVGPNYNDPADPDRFKKAHDAIARAEELAANASPSEKAYIAAMARRFPSDPAADHRLAAERYRNAMGDVVKQFPDDLDAATLFAEAGMDLHPWGLWRPDGTPEAGTEDIIAALESVLKRDPNHMGAIHYYIHAVEASPNPERALAAANRLAALAPAAGHLVHMPGHVYIRTGDFEAAVKTNQLAASADRAYMQANGAGGMYGAMYYSHNLHFIAACSSMNGNYAEARKAAEMLAAHVGPHVKDVPPLEGFMTVPIAVEVRFQKWDQILAMPQPAAAMQTTTVFWHFARGMALAAKGKVTEAEAEHHIVSEAADKTPPDQVFAMPVNNKAKDVLTIATNVLGAKIALAKRDSANAISMLHRAVAIQDALKYDEPPDWFYPVRESLGAVLLLNGNAAEAEKVFREDLDRNPRNPRSLFGLSEALRAQNRGYDAQFVDKQFQSNWKSAEIKLKVADLT